MKAKDVLIDILNKSNIPLSAQEIWKQNKNLLQAFYQGKTPESTLQSRLGDFIRENDTRVSRHQDGSVYKYYSTLNKNRNNEDTKNTDHPIKENKSYVEKSLHPLLATFLNTQKQIPITINHNESKKDGQANWVYPDLVSVEFIEYDKSNEFFRQMNTSESIILRSYEIKKEIHSDRELKEYFFQAVSNSSWSHYGYLVALEINEKLKSEIERLNDAFGIGIIKLNPNTFTSSLWF